MVKRNFKKIIIGELSCVSMKNQKTFVSKLKLVRSIKDNCEIKYSSRRLNSYIRKALEKMLELKSVIKKKNSYSLAIDIKTSKIDKRNKIYPVIKKKKTTQKTKMKKNKKIKSKNTINNMVSYNIVSNHAEKTPSVSHSSHPIWQFYDDNNFNAKIKNPDGWYNYDSEASNIVESIWQIYIVNRGMNDVRAVKSGEWEYMVDFINWKQTNVVHKNHTVRKVRRLDENGQITLNPYTFNAAQVL